MVFSLMEKSGMRIGLDIDEVDGENIPGGLYWRLFINSDYVEDECMGVALF